MKIVYLHQYFNTPAMAGGTRSYEMARRLVARGHEVHMITSDRQGSPSGSWRRSREAGIEVHWLPVPYDNRMGTAERVRAFFAYAIGAGRRAAGIDADVVFATSTPLTIALPAVYAARRLRVPMVFEVRDLWPELPIAVGALRGRLPVALAHRLERFAYRHARQIVALSPGMRDGVVRSGFPAERVAVIPNSADLELFDVGDDGARDFRARYPWLGARPLVIYAGTLGKINGVDYLVRLAAAVRARDPEVRFLIVGSGQMEPSLRALAEELGVLGNNLFMEGRLPKQDMPALFAAATVTTSLFLPLPQMEANSANKFFDGLASGTPVAINYGGWQRELLRTAEAGLSLDPHDPEGACDTLLAALADPDALARMGANARRLARERFDRDVLARELEHVLERAVGARPA